ncbi:E3 ubiquitin-protein ligase rnf8 isoform X1 [Colossoma macropomum]|uniref:E3 ubiquitin-protein ligase rnf8 isoform X1 n=2 Tax=Colossoma macropomum TaxID=42526 RepID=UPI0018652FE7|nr:E3 ubiquitin-protein ligase rnf8 isoform X1 [Colossoma macropomum]
MEDVDEEPSSPEGENPINDKIWCLKRVGKDTGWLRLNENSEVTIGRGLNVTHQILSVSCPLMISRNHCMLKQREDGQWTVTDNESINGVWVNGTRISTRKPHVLQQGDAVRLGVPLDGNPVEFEYILVHRRLSKIKDFLTKAVGTEAVANISVPKPKKSKRKFGTDEVEAGTTLDSKSKLYRSSNTDKSSAQPCPTAAAHQRVLPACRGPDVPPGSSTHCSDSSQQLATLQRYNNNLRALKERMGATQKRAAKLAGQERASPEQQRKMQELQEQMEVLRGQLNSQQEMALHRVEMLEKSICEEERRLEIQQAQQNEDGLKKQLEEALKEQRKVIEELKHAREGFKEVLQAKDKELEVTKEEKEKARAQKEEVVTQMTEVLENELQCIICSELFIEAVTLNCAHSFCQHCIGDWRRRKDECPICRQAILSQTRSLVLDNCIDRMVENLSAEMKERRLALIRERKGQSKAPSVAVVVIQDSSSSDGDLSVYSSTEGYLVNPRFPYCIDSSDSSSWSD